MAQTNGLTNTPQVLSRPSGPREGNPRKRIGIVDLDVGFSGITRYTLALLRGLAGEEFEVVLFCRREPHYRDLDGVRIVYVGNQLTRTEWDGTPAEDQDAEAEPRSRAGIRWLWHRLVPCSVRQSIGFLKAARRLSKVFRAESVDLLHVQIVEDADSALAGYLARVPLVVGTYHINPRQGRKHRWLTEISTSRCLGHSVFVSESTKDEWCRHRHFDPSHVSVIPNGVEVRPDPRRGDRGRALRELGLPPDADGVIVAVGRLAEQKGHRYLLDAAAALVDQFPRLYVVLAGDGPLRQDLESQARQLGIAHHVKFLGHCRDVQPVLDAGDVFALPSLWEAMPFALLEAMANGVPVVATPVAGVPELIEPGVTGMLVPPADGPALAASLRTLLTMPDRGSGLAATARARVDERYSLRAMQAQTCRLYRQLLLPTWSANQPSPRAESHPL